MKIGPPLSEVVTGVDPLETSLEAQVPELLPSSTESGQSSDEEESVATPLTSPEDLSGDETPPVDIAGAAGEKLEPHVQGLQSQTEPSPPVEQEEPAVDTPQISSESAGLNDSDGLETPPVDIARTAGEKLEPQVPELQSQTEPSSPVEQEEPAIETPQISSESAGPALGAAEARGPDAVDREEPTVPDDTNNSNSMPVEPGAHEKDASSQDAAQFDCRSKHYQDGQCPLPDSNTIESDAAQPDSSGFSSNEQTPIEQDATGTEAAADNNPTDNYSTTDDGFVMILPEWFEEPEEGEKTRENTSEEAGEEAGEGNGEENKEEENVEEEKEGEEKEDEEEEDEEEHDPYGDEHEIKGVFGPDDDSDGQEEQEKKSDDTEKKTKKERVLSPAEKEWARQKEEFGETNEALDTLMSMVGIESVKTAFLSIKGVIETARARKGVLNRRDLNLILTGNPGTGKSTVVKLYRDFLHELNVWPDHKSSSSTPEIVEKTGLLLQRTQDVSDIGEKLSPSDIGTKGGVLFINALDKMDSDYVHRLSGIIDTYNKNVVMVFTGDATGISKILGSRPHDRWTFRRRLHMEDYDDEQLRLILTRIVRRHGMKMEGGMDGPCPRIMARRIGRNRGTPGFGNIHDLMLAFQQALDRQAARLDRARAGPVAKEVEADTKGGEEAYQVKDEFATEKVDKSTEDKRILTIEDMVGPEPTDIRDRSEAWKKLEKMAGLADVKQAISSLMDRAGINYRRELQGKEPLKTSLNRVFLGPPGTGKTTVARLYGQIVGELGLLSKKEVVYTKAPGDYIGKYIGWTEAATNRILNDAIGKVLIIDDAHTLFRGSQSCGGGDVFRTACIDTLVAGIQNVPGEDRCVILLGYTDDMEEMFQKSNPGLRRRFPLEQAFRFYDYDDEQLTAILKLKMDEEGITADAPAMEVASEVLRRARDRPNFGNGGDVENILNHAKTRCRDRRRKERQELQLPGPEDEDSMVLTREDFDPEWNRGASASTKCIELFRDLIGFEDVVKKFQGYQRVAATMRRRGKDPREMIPFTFLFKGPPGTGKTHTARIVGQIFYDMGFLSTNDVIECSASQLIGQYQGQTAPKVVSTFDKALGKVLFIDEAYRLGAKSSSGSRSYEEEAIGEMVDCMTKKKYMRKMVIVLAGYDRDMERLVEVNPGLRGRFATEISFPRMDAAGSKRFLLHLLLKEDIDISDGPNSRGERGLEKKEKKERTLLQVLDKLSMTPGWSNARDMKTLASQITAHVYENADDEEEVPDVEVVSRPAPAALKVSTNLLIEFSKAMLRVRMKSGGEGGSEA